MAMSRALLPPVSREAPLCSSRAATWGWLFRMAWVRGVRPWHGCYYIGTLHIKGIYLSVGLVQQGGGGL